MSRLYQTVLVYTHCPGMTMNSAPANLERHDSEDKWSPTANCRSHSSLPGTLTCWLVVFFPPLLTPADPPPAWAHLYPSVDHLCLIQEGLKQKMRQLCVIWCASKDASRAPTFKNPLPRPASIVLKSHDQDPPLFCPEASPHLAPTFTSLGGLETEPSCALPAGPVVSPPLYSRDSRLRDGQQVPLTWCVRTAQSSPKGSLLYTCLD